MLPSVPLLFSFGLSVGYQDWKLGQPHQETTSTVKLALAAGKRKPQMSQVVLGQPQLRAKLLPIPALMLQAKLTKQRVAMARPDLGRASEWLSLRRASADRDSQGRAKVPRQKRKKEVEPEKPAPAKRDPKEKPVKKTES